MKLSTEPKFLDLATTPEQAKCPHKKVKGPLSTMPQKGKKKYLYRCCECNALVEKTK